MPRFRRIQTDVDAFQWVENGGVNPGNAVKHELIDFGTAAFCVTTIHGQKTVVKDGDWIITEPDGIHHYPCKPEIFERTYEPACGDECHFQEPYGFVPHAGCPVHD